MRLSKKFTTVTRFSRYLALSLFIILPIIAFLYGMYFQKAIDQSTSPAIIYAPSSPIKPNDLTSPNTPSPTISPN
jgi:membrane protein YdbS with pleckstrin-like domain